MKSLNSVSVALAKKRLGSSFVESGLSRKKLYFVDHYPITRGMCPFSSRVNSQFYVFLFRVLSSLTAYSVGTEGSKDPPTVAAA